MAWVRNRVCIYSGSDWAFWAVKSVGGLWFLRLCRRWFCLLGFVLLLFSNQWFLKLFKIFCSAKSYVN